MSTELKVEIEDSILYGVPKRFYRIFKDEKYCGIANLCYISSDKSIHLQWIGVIEEMRNQGIGTYLLKYVLQDAEENWSQDAKGIGLCDVSQGSSIYTRNGIPEQQGGTWRFYCFKKFDFIAFRVKERHQRLASMKSIFPHYYSNQK